MVDLTAEKMVGNLGCLKVVLLVGRKVRSTADLMAVETVVVRVVM